MNTWAMCGLFCVVVIGCGGRTQALLGEIEAEPPSVSSPSGGRSYASTLGTGGNTQGGTVSTGGTIGLGGSKSVSSTSEVLPAEITVNVPGPVRWFTARKSNGSFFLVGVAADFKTSVTELPRLSGEPPSDPPMMTFSPRGDRFIYALGRDCSQIGVGTLSSKSASVRIRPIAAEASVDSVRCAGWLTDTLFAMETSQVGNAEVTKPLVISADPNEQIPEGTPALPFFSERSPNGKYLLSIGDSPLTIYRLTEQGIRDEAVLVLPNRPVSLWSWNSARFLTATDQDENYPPLLQVYDLPKTSGTASLIRTPSTMTAGHIHECRFSTDGRYLSKLRAYSDDAEFRVTDLADLDTGKSAVVSNDIGHSAEWLGNMLIGQQPGGDGGALVGLPITPESIAAGTIALGTLTDQHGALSQVSLLGRLSEMTYLILRGGVNNRQILQTVTATDSGFTTEDIVPGAAGDASIGLVWGTGLTRLGVHSEEGPHLYFGVAAAPSYIDLDFYEGKLFRYVRLRDYLNEDYNYGMRGSAPAPGLVGSVAYNFKTKEHAWLYLVGPNSGRLIPLSIPGADDETDWFFPRYWP